MLRLDDRGVGQSGGSIKAATTADLVRDAQAGLNYLRKLPSIDPARMGLIGHGEGGNVALLSAARSPPPELRGGPGGLGRDGPGAAGQPARARKPRRYGPGRYGPPRRPGRGSEAGQPSCGAGGSNAAQIDTYVAQQRLKLKNEERKQARATVKFRQTMLEIVKQTARRRPGPGHRGEHAAAALSQPGPGRSSGRGPWS